MIFLIDDDQSVLKALLLLLRASGFEARGFSSATDFLKQSLISDNDCLILDLSMPGMSGFNLMESLASSGINAKVIIITAFDDAVNREKARKLKAMAFLTKPVDDQALIDTIKWVFHSEKKEKDLRQIA
jgi:two-component system, LuxR family, response regulator FixJ